MHNIHAPISRPLIILLGFSVGAIAANLYYAQPLVALIAKSLGLAASAAGFTVTLTQLGYGVGVLFITPLGDLIENKKLILSMLCLAIISLLGLVFSEHIVSYFISAFLTGLGVSALQVIVPYTAHLTPEKIRGRVVGSLMSGLMLGIMLSRPMAGFLTDLFSWHTVFLVSSGFMTILAILLYKFLPERKPPVLSVGYRGLLESMGKLFIYTEVLRRRSIYQAFMFSAFCLFWTAVPLFLASPAFHLSQTGIALFALAGVAGVVVAPWTGRLADQGLSQVVTTAALISGSISFLITHLFEPGSTMSLVFLVIAAILLDAGVTANLVLGQRAIFSLEAHHRSRLNGLYVSVIFVGGSLGSLLGAWAFATGGWSRTSLIGFLMPFSALMYFITEKKFSKN